LLDFGVARLLQPETDGISLTRAYGLAVTPEYASPELLRRDPIDLRSDIYSLGVVLHELLTGVRPPASGEMARSLGAGLGEVVKKALQPSPGDRYPDAASFAAALRPFTDQQTYEQSQRHKFAYGWVAALVLLVLGAGGAGFYWLRPGPTSGQPEVRSLAVLPLQSVDANDHALGFGIADAVIRRISNTGAITVRPASSVRHYLEQETDAQTAARELAVDSVLEGTVQRVGDHVRIGVSLSKADGTLLWTESFDTQTTDVFAAQDTIAQQVATQLQLHLTRDQRTRLTKRSTSNPIAYDYYTRAAFSYDQRGRGPKAADQNETTIDLFKRAIGADPNYALAHASLAHAYAFHGLFIIPTEQEKWFALANEEIRRADAIDAQLPETHLARATVLYSETRGWQAAAAIREARAAQRLNPNLGQHELAEFYYHFGLEDLAEREFQRAFEIDPTSTILSGDYVSWQLLLHHPDEFAAALRRYFPEAPLPFLYHVMKGDIDAVQRMVDEAGAKDDGGYLPLMKSYLLAFKGDRKGSEEFLAKFIGSLSADRKRSNNYHHLAYDIASVYALNGNGTEAMKWLRVSAALGFRSYPLFSRDPLLDNIRQLPEFGQFLAEIKTEYDGLRKEFGRSAAVTGSSLLNSRSRHSDRA
jgi:TolB-like protein/Tfp pilus assembly protein PilF